MLSLVQSIKYPVAHPFDDPCYKSMDDQLFMGSSYTGMVMVFSVSSGMYLFTCLAGGGCAGIKKILMFRDKYAIAMDTKFLFFSRSDNRMIGEVAYAQGKRYSDFTCMASTPLNQALYLKKHNSSMIDICDVNLMLEHKMMVIPGWIFDGAFHSDNMWVDFFSNRLLLSDRYACMVWMADGDKTEMMWVSCEPRLPHAPQLYAAVSHAHQLIVLTGNKYTNKLQVYDTASKNQRTAETEATYLRRLDLTYNSICKAWQVITFSVSQSKFLVYE